jgi:hypothetical protein
MMRTAGLLLLATALSVGAPSSASAQWLLVPMDRQQRDHLKAYGLTHWALERELRAEWLLNYRDGSFLLVDNEAVRREAALRGVTIVPTDAATEARIRQTIARPRTWRPSPWSGRPASPSTRPRTRSPGTTPSPWRSSTRASNRDDLGSRGPDRGSLELRVDPPPSRGLHRPVFEVLHLLFRGALAAGGGRKEPGGRQGSRVR